MNASRKSIRWWRTNQRRRSDAIGTGPFVAPDLGDIAALIAEDNPVRAISFIAKIGQRFSEIAQNPLIYRLRSEIGETACMSVHGNYVILFLVADGVERFAYGGRDFPGLYDDAR